MSKTKLGFIIFMAAILVGCSLLLQYYKQLYKVLPIQRDDPGTASLEPHVAEPHPLGAIPSPEMLNDWVDYRSLRGGFHVFLPVYPQNAKEKITDPKTKEVRKYDTYISERGDGTIFMISLITLPSVPDKASVEEVLKGFVDDMVAGSENNKLISSNKTTFKSLPAIDFSIENQEVTIKGIAFFKQDLIGILTRISKVSNRNINEFVFFTNSFDFTVPKEGN